MSKYLFLDCESIPPGTPPSDPAELEAWTALALRPGSAHIVCMSWALSDGVVSTVQDARSINAVLWEYRALPWVAHGGRRFDFPLLYCNLVRAGSRSGAAQVLADRMRCKPWETQLIDTAKMGGAWVKLSEYCEMHGVQGKTDSIGADIWRIWPDDPARVIAYCEGDVECLRAAHREAL